MRAEREVNLGIDDVGPSRHWARGHLEESGVTGSRLELLALLVSELVTNAVEHAWPPVVLSVDVSAARIRVEVTDGNRDVPILRIAGANSDSGRGVWLIDQLASRWGTDIDHENHTKAVWFELHADDERPVLDQFA